MPRPTAQSRASSGVVDQRSRARDQVLVRHLRGERERGPLQQDELVAANVIAVPLRADLTVVLPRVDLDRDLQLGIREIDANLLAAEDHAVLLLGQWQTGCGDCAHCPRLEITLAGVVTRPPFCKHRVHSLQRATGTRVQAADAPSHVVERAELATEQVVERLAQLSAGHPAGDVDQRSRWTDDRYATSSGEVGVEQLLRPTPDDARHPDLQLDGLDDLDGIGLLDVPNVPEVSAGAMRRIRVGPGGQHGGQDHLLPGSRRARDRIHAWTDLEPDAAAQQARDLGFSEACLKGLYPRR